MSTKNILNFVMVEFMGELLAYMTVQVYLIKWSLSEFFLAIFRISYNIIYYLPARFCTQKYLLKPIHVFKM